MRLKEAIRFLGTGLRIQIRIRDHSGCLRFQLDRGDRSIAPVRRDSQDDTEQQHGGKTARPNLCCR